MAHSLTIEMKKKKVDKTRRIGDENEEFHDTKYIWFYVNKTNILITLKLALGT